MARSNGAITIFKLPYSLHRLHHVMHRACQHKTRSRDSIYFQLLEYLIRIDFGRDIGDVRAECKHFRHPCPDFRAHAGRSALEGLYLASIKPTNCGNEAAVSSQFAFEPTKICAIGRSAMSLSIVPIRTHTTPGFCSLLLIMGEPQRLQKSLA